MEQRNYNCGVLEYRIEVVTLKTRFL